MASGSELLELIERIAKAYAPEVRLHSQERYFPCRAEWYIQRSIQTQRDTRVSNVQDSCKLYENNGKDASRHPRITERITTHHTLLRSVCTYNGWRMEGDHVLVPAPVESSRLYMRIDQLDAQGGEPWNLEHVPMYANAIVRRFTEVGVDGVQEGETEAGGDEQAGANDETVGTGDADTAEVTTEPAPGQEAECSSGVVDEGAAGTQAAAEHQEQQSGGIVLDVVDVQYFFCYGYNGPLLSYLPSAGIHEGDWEHITVRVKMGPSNDIATSKIIAVYFAAHGSEGRWLFKCLKKETDPHPTRSVPEQQAFDHTVTNVVTEANVSRLASARSVASKWMEQRNAAAIDEAEYQTHCTGYTLNSEGHVVVYSAKFSHASYSTPGQQRRFVPLGIIDDVTDGRGRSWYGYRNMVLLSPIMFSPLWQHLGVTPLCERLRRCCEGTPFASKKIAADDEEQSAKSTAAEGDGVPSGSAEEDGTSRGGDGGSEIEVIFVGAEHPMRKVWDDRKTHAKPHRVTFFHPSSVNGFEPTASVAQRHHDDKPETSACVMLVRAPASGRASAPPVANPVDWNMVWMDKGSGGKYGRCSLWEPVPPEGYVALGHVAWDDYTIPPLDLVKCVRADIAVPTHAVTQSDLLPIWSDKNSGAKFGSVSVLSPKPVSGGLVGDAIIAIRSYDPPTRMYHALSRAAALVHPSPHLRGIRHDEVVSSNLMWCLFPGRWGKGFSEQFAEGNAPRGPGCKKYAWKGQEVTPEISVGLQEAVESGEVDEKDIAFGDSFSLNVHLYTSMTAHEQ